MSSLEAPSYAPGLAPEAPVRAKDGVARVMPWWVVALGAIGLVVGTLGAAQLIAPSPARADYCSTAHFYCDAEAYGAFQARSAVTGLVNGYTMVFGFLAGIPWIVGGALTHRWRRTGWWVLTSGWAIGGTWAATMIVMGERWWLDRSMVDPTLFRIDLVFATAFVVLSQAALAVALLRLRRSTFVPRRADPTDAARAA